MPIRACKHQVLVIGSAFSQHCRPSHDMLELQLSTGSCEQVVSAHRLGKEHDTWRMVQSLFDVYLHVNERFSAHKESTEREKIKSMRGVKVCLPHCVAGTGQSQLAKEYNSDLGELVDIVVSHQGLPMKVALISQLLETLLLPVPDQHQNQLRCMTAQGCAACPYNAVTMLHKRQASPS